MNTKKIGIIGIIGMLLFLGIANAQSINPFNVSAIYNAPQAVNNGTSVSSVFNPNMVQIDNILIINAFVFIGALTSIFIWNIIHLLLYKKKRA